MHKKHLRSSISLVLTLSLLLCFVVKAGAVTPRWTSINSIDLQISFDGSDGNASGVATKQSTATKIEGRIYLYEFVDGEWSFIDEWYGSKSRGTLMISAAFDCVSGVSYKAVFVVTAYTGTATETETVEYIDTCP